MGGTQLYLKAVGAKADPRYPRMPQPLLSDSFTLLLEIQGGAAGIAAFYTFDFIRPFDGNLRVYSTSTDDAVTDSQARTEAGALMRSIQRVYQARRILLLRPPLTGSPGLTCCPPVLA